MRRLFTLSFCVSVLLQINAFAARPSVAKQDVVGGTKVNEAIVGSFIDTECTDSYFGCMDAFCMVDNVSGGRCQCSNKHKELSNQFDEILKKQEEIDNISKYGADFVKIANVESDINSITESAKKKTTEKTEKPKTALSRDDWNAMFAKSDDDDDEEEYVDNDDISNKHGDELYVAADEMCFEQTPSKCKANGEMLKMLYVQKIKSDCAAFETLVKKESSETNVKLSDAQNELRNVALSEFENANKYGLGQCMREFKQCMQTTAGCKSDFAGCVTLSAHENVKDDAKTVSLADDLIDTQISVSTMDNLLSKKVLCESVLNDCVAVKNDVWDVFLKDIAPIVKTAELNAEHELRTNCIKTVSDCYVKSCHEHFDVNQENGSYDMCLARPENYKSFCKIELEPCLTATGGSYEKPSESRLWNGIISQLNSMRATACTDEFKACIQDDERCGEDYSKCIGLDESDIAELCPDDKLTACYHEYEGKKETVRETLANVANGVLLQVHSGLAEVCDNAVKEAMIKMCDSNEDCNALILTDNQIGARTLDLKFCEISDNKGKYDNCKTEVSEITDIELGKTIRNADLSKTKHERLLYLPTISGGILWDHIRMNSDYTGIISADEYVKDVESLVYMDTKTKDKIKTEIGAIGNAIKNTILAIETDPRVQFCMTGRQVAGLTSTDGLQQYIGKSKNAVFPNITKSMRITIINAALLQAQEHYNKKYDEIIVKASEGLFDLQMRHAKIKDANFKMNEQDLFRQQCIDMGEFADFAHYSHKRYEKPTPFYYDPELELGRNTNKGNDGKLVGYSSESTLYLKSQVTTVFNMDKNVCTKCRRTQKCKDRGGNYCKAWDEEKETCEEIKY